MIDLLLQDIKEGVLMQNRAIKYRIYPSAEQKILFAKTFGCCRKIWNLMLADKITYYQQTKKMLQTTPAQYKKAYPYLCRAKNLVCQNVWMLQEDLEPDAC